jgi:hypothetical protein
LDTDHRTAEKVFAAFASQGLSSIEPTQRGDHVERREEVPGGLVITCRGATEPFRPAEEVLDQMSSFVQRFVMFWDRSGSALVGSRRYSPLP